MRLEPTACVLGAFSEWGCEVQEPDLDLGDLPAIFADGITEAMNAEGEKLGEDRLIAALRPNLEGTAQEILDAVCHVVQQYSGRDQTDDLTLIVSRVVASAPCMEDRRSPEGQGTLPDSGASEDGVSVFVSLADRTGDL